MKIRIKGNSVRFRLGQSEIALFGKEGFLEDRTEFPGGRIFHYALQRKKGVSALEADFSENRITVYVPEAISNEWTRTDIVGFENRQELGNGNRLFLLIEKDFVCLDHTTEDQSDNYPNPNKVC